MCLKNFSAKEYSLKIESLISYVNTSSFIKSDDILLAPYESVISVLEYRVPKNKLEKFKLYYQNISGESLQELLDDNYNIELLIKDIQHLIKNEN